MSTGLNMMIIYFCIMFCMYLADPELSTGFFDFTQGTYVIGWDTLILFGISGLAGLITAGVTRDAMTGVITTIASAMVGWIIIPSSFLAGAPYDIGLFATTLMNIIWGWSVISFIRAYQA